MQNIIFVCVDISKSDMSEKKCANETQCNERLTRFCYTLFLTYKIRVLHNWKVLVTDISNVLLISLKEIDHNIVNV